MAAKKTTAATRGKARAKAKKPAAKPAPKKPAKRATASQRAAPAKKPSTKKPSAKTPSAKTPRRAPVAAPVEAADTATIAELEAAAAASDDAEAKKPGALARLKSGMGNLFARMTGRKAAPTDDDAGEPAGDRTIDIVTRDIIVEPPVPPPPKRKRGAESA